MCELLGMSANTTTDIRFSLSGLIQRGGVTGPHRDIVAIIATRALTHEEPWRAMEPGDFTVFRGGRRMRA